MIKVRDRLGKEVDLGLLGILLLLVGCSSELDKMIAECQDQFPPYVEEMEELGEEWEDTLEIAASTSRIALSAPVGELQAIRRKASRLEPPVCIADEHENFVEGMDTFTGLFLDFMAEADSEPEEMDTFTGLFLDFMAEADSEPEEMDIKIATLQMLILAESVTQYLEDPEGFFDEFRDIAGTATAEAE